MKKTIAVILLLLIIMSMSACGDRVESTVSSSSDVAGKSIGYLENTISDQYVNIVFSDSNLVSYSSPAAAAGDLKTGVLDCIISDGVLASAITDSQSGIKKLGEPITVLDVGFMCARERGDLASVLSDAIESLKENDILDKIIKNYTGGGDYIYQPASANYEKSLKVGVVVMGEPYTYYNEEGQLVGFEADITRAVCDELGIGVEFVPMEKSNIESSIITGQIDMAIGGLFPIEGGSEFVTFSDPYYKAEQIIITRK